MQVPYFNFQDYLAPSRMNNMALELASGCTDLISKMYSPGLVRPDAITFTTGGLSGSATLPAPFGVLFSSGNFSTAHGNTIGQDTQNYTFDFTSLVPASGPSVTAYLLATYSQVFQSPEIITGPPQGHPAYDAAFVAYVGYTVNRDTITLSTSTGAPDNIASFEVARCILTSGASTLSGFTTAYQNLASLNIPKTSISISANLALSPAQAYNWSNFISSGLALSLPLASGSNGLWYFITNSTSGSNTLDTQGNDLIYGGWLVSGAASIPIQPYGGLLVGSTGNSWNIISQNLASIPILYGVDTGSINTLAINLPINISSYTSLIGKVISVLVGNTNTGSSTININAISTAGIINSDGSNLNPNQLTVNSIALLVYNGSSFILIGGGSGVEGTIGTILGNNSSTPALTVSDTSNSRGVSIKLLGSGGSTPNKTINVKSGVFNIENSAGNSNIVTVDDSGNLTAAGAIAGYGPLSPNGFSHMVVVTGTLNWTVPANVTSVRVICVGGGGGGAGAVSGSSFIQNSGGAAAGGAQGIYSVTPGQVITVTIGAGGLGGPTDSAGATGGTSSFGSFCTAYGGTGGTYNSSTTAFGGAAVGGAININGGPGFLNSNNTSSLPGGGGGNTPFGLGFGGAASSNQGSAGVGYGAGGASYGNRVGGVGGNGTPGVVIIWY